MEWNYWFDLPEFEIQSANGIQFALLLPKYSLPINYSNLTMSKQMGYQTQISIVGCDVGQKHFQVYNIPQYADENGTGIRFTVIWKKRHYFEIFQWLESCITGNCMSEADRKPPAWDANDNCMCEVNESGPCTMQLTAARCPGTGRSCLWSLIGGFTPTQLAFTHTSPVL